MPNGRSGRHVFVGHMRQRIGLAAASLILCDPLFHIAHGQKSLTATEQLADYSYVSVHLVPPVLSAEPPVLESLSDHVGKDLVPPDVD